MSKYIQVEFDAHNQAAAIATAAKITRQWVIAGLVDMWAHCFRARTDRISSIQVVGFFSEPIGHVLEAFQFLERIDDSTWRVRGMGRYTSLAEKRKAAGSKGGTRTQASKTDQIANDSSGEAQANSEQGPFAQANAKQNTLKPAVCSSKPKQVLKQKSISAKQNQALYPRSDSSSPTGKKNYRLEDQREAPFAPSSPDGDGAGAVQVRQEATPPPRPKLVEGTREYDMAVALGDWDALGWGAPA